MSRKCTKKWNDNKYLSCSLVKIRNLQAVHEFKCRISRKEEAWLQIVAPKMGRRCKWGEQQEQEDMLYANNIPKLPREGCDRYPECGCHYALVLRGDDGSVETIDLGYDLKDDGECTARHLTHSDCRYRPFNEPGRGEPSPGTIGENRYAMHDYDRWQIAKTPHLDLPTHYKGIKIRPPGHGEVCPMGEAQKGTIYTDLDDLPVLPFEGCDRSPNCCCFYIWVEGKIRVDDDDDG